MDDMSALLPLKERRSGCVRLLFLSGVLILCLFLSGCVPATVASAQNVSQKQSTNVLWDSWGVPHIFAPDNEALFYGFAYAQMHNNADLLLPPYVEARGRAAEYWGASYLAP